MEVRSRRADRHHARIEDVELTCCDASDMQPPGKRSLDVQLHHHDLGCTDTKAPDLGTVTSSTCLVHLRFDKSPSACSEMVPAATPATTPDPRSTATCLSSTETCRDFRRWPPPPSVDKYGRTVRTLLGQHRSEPKVQTVDHTVCSQSIVQRSTSHVRSWDLLRPLMASNCCFWGALGCSEVVCFGVFG